MRISCVCGIIRYVSFVLFCLLCVLSSRSMPFVHAFTSSGHSVVLYSMNTSHIHPLATWQCLGSVHLCSYEWMMLLRLLLCHPVRSCVFSSPENCWVWVWCVSLWLPDGSSLFEGYRTFRSQSLAGESWVTQDEPGGLIVEHRAASWAAPITMHCILSFKNFSWIINM